MLLDALLSYAHFVFAFILFGALAGEAFVLRLAQNAASLRLLVRMDMFYGLSALGVIAAGLARVFYGVRGAAFYGGEPFFWAKLAVFAAVGIISIWPTMRFLSWRRALIGDEGFVPPEAEVKAMRRLVMIELHLLALVPLFAAFMARGMRFW